MLCSFLMCSSNDTVLLSNLSLSSPAREQNTHYFCNYYNNIIRTFNAASHHTGFPLTSLISGWNLPQMKQVVFRISSLPCFSLLRSANVSMITPKMRFRTMMMTMKKNSRSYTTRAANMGSCDE